MSGPKFKFGAKSLERLATCHPDLQRICHELIKEMDVTVLCGHRGEEEQNLAYRQGKSRLRWPLSAHNSIPSRAVDLAPYPIDWNDRPRFLRMQGRVRRIAEELGIELRALISWDLPHVELKRVNKSAEAA